MSNGVVDYKDLMSKALLALKKKQEKLAAFERAACEPIAIIGMACRFPGGVNTPADLWQMLADGRDAIGEIPSNRWDVARFFDSDPTAAGKMNSSRGGFVDNVDGFDPLFFGMSPKEATFVDPQQRLMLEVAWEALENAQLVPDDLYGSKTGVLVGISTMDYCNLISEHLPKDEISRHIGTGTAFSPAAGRISYLLGLNGPAMAIDTACSSSLVATHLAVESLRRRETDLMIVGGVGLILSPMNSITFSRARMLAADGRCKTFSDSADGYGRGEGVAVVLLKRLSDAEKDGDTVLAVIRGSAVNQDGARGGLTIPNGPAQQAVVRQALANGRVDAGDISYVEVHGTGMFLGDPIEVGALGAVFRSSHDQTQPLLIGALKSNIGHTEAAAGLAGVIKVVLQLQHRQLTPSLHVGTPNTKIDWATLPVSVSTRFQPWLPRNGKWLAGVSAFGFSGTNAHVILERAPLSEGAVSGDQVSREFRIFLLSAQKPQALTDLIARYVDYLADGQILLHDLCCSAALGRKHFDERVAVVACSVQDLRIQLQLLLDGRAGDRVFDSRQLTRQKKAGFHLQLPSGLPGEPHMETNPIYVAAVAECQSALAEFEWLAADDVADFFILYARARVWQSWGVQTSMLAGYGPAAAVLACLAGVLPLSQALPLFAAAQRVNALDRTSVTSLQQLASELTYARPAIPLLPDDGPITTPNAWVAQLMASPNSAPDFTDGLWLDFGCSDIAIQIARLYGHGLNLDWTAIVGASSYRKVQLLNYAFQRQRYWPNLR